MSKVCEHIDEQSDSCQFVYTYCQDTSNILDYLALRYCHVFDDAELFLYYILLIIWGCYLVSIMSSTAENHFMPALQYLSKELRLSPALAGVTLLAFGNASPDIFTSIAALRSGDSALALSAVIGAVCFNTSITLAGILLVKYPIHAQFVSPPDFYRDVLALLTVSGVVAILAHMQSLVIAEAFLFILAYIIYVATIVYMAKQKEKEEKTGTFSINLHENQEYSTDYGTLPEGGIGTRETIIRPTSGSVGMLRVIMVIRVITTGYIAMFQYLRPLLDVSQTLMISVICQRVGTDSDDDHVDEGSVNDPTRGAAHLNGLTWPSDPSKINIIVYLFKFPVCLLLWLSMPSTNYQWSRTRRY